MPILNYIATAAPERRFTQTEVAQTAPRWLGHAPETQALFERVLRTAGVTTRHFISSPLEVLELGGMEPRAKLFEQHGVPLAVETAARALAGHDPSTVRTLIFTSCTTPSIPSVDALILEAAGLPRTVSRIPVYQHGCAAGVFSLALGNRLCEPGKPVLCTALELCSLVFHSDDTRGSSVVASAIFGDGAASAFISSEGEGLEIIASQSYLVPHSREQMGYDIFDNGAHLRLLSDLPQVLAKTFPPLVRAFLQAHSLQETDIPFWLFHPGGIKILSIFEEEFNLKRGEARWSRQVLSQNGNMSSATIMFVLAEFMRERPWKKGDLSLVVGVGPGLTLELILLRSTS